MTSSIQGQSKIRVRREMREISIPQSATSACAYDEAAKKMDGSMEIHHKPSPFCRRSPLECRSENVSTGW
ncbi:uncharacterized protein TrAtP1_008389 [Trichoderma atroviride]|uniref:uncharacterized protein n=1 Tax=Hypocrea atroviridis TaxID=63577 RepID=UPI00331888FD|nr:hypothetical protein TrAtP1_008389 [Trichoderma atroviride]